MIIALVAATMLPVTLVSCNGKSTDNGKVSNEVTTAEVTMPKTDAKVVVLSFHGKQRCATCMAIEKETNILLEGELADLAKSGKVQVREVDFSTDEGKEIAKKYQVASTSIFVVTNPGENEMAEDLTPFAFAKARSHGEEFRIGLKEKILAGVNN